MQKIVVAKREIYSNKKVFARMKNESRQKIRKQNEGGNNLVTFIIINSSLGL